LYISFEDFSIDIEHEKDKFSKKDIRVLKSFDQLFPSTDPNGEGVLQCLEMYGFITPSKLQMHAIPAIAQSFQMTDSSPAGKSRAGKSCLIVQGPEQIGKTSSLVLALLGSLDTSLPACQAVVVSPKKQRDFEKYFNVFTLMHPAQCASSGARAAASFIEALCPEPENDEEQGGETPFGGLAEDPPPGSGPGWNPHWIAQEHETDEEILLQARKAHVIVGDPASLLRMCSKPDLNMEHVRVLVIDDAQLISADAQTLKGKEREDASQLDDVIKICQTLEVRSEHRLRYVISSQFTKGDASSDASKKTLRLLKNSLMKKKNLLSAGLTTTTMKAHKQVKHYVVQAPRRDWVRILKSLVSSLMFPRAIIFTDDQRRERLDMFLRDMKQQGLDVSVNLSNMRKFETKPQQAQQPPNQSPPGTGRYVSFNDKAEEGACSRVDDSAESRRTAVQEFSSGRSQFLFTTSEPAVCQLVLPKVKAVFHFDVPSDLLSIYGVRLLPLEQLEATQAQDQGVSILFVESAAKVADISKLFGVTFTDVPFEYIPQGPL
jgi:superfamily II DNA/RNA helicase